jgi:small GTP-binding protein
MINIFKKFLNLFFKDLFQEKGSVRLGLYGPPNGGKTTLANKICKDWIGEEMGRTSKIAHETRQVQVKEQITIKRDAKELTFSLVDTPGIATKIDYEEFIKAGLPEAEAKTRAKEATKGVIDAIKWLDDMDCVIVVLDATKDPYTQVNITIIGNLDARKIPVLLVANKMDLKKADLKHVQSAFPQYEVIGISAKTGDGVEALYEKLFELRSKALKRKKEKQ